MADSRHRFVYLDGLRGVAALAVAFQHAIHLARFEGRWVANIGMAVDFFFCLSGFVVACAYERQLSEKMTLGAFMGKRFDRLYPMIALGILNGTLLFLISGHRTVLEAVAYAAAAVALVPAGLVGHTAAFPANPPMWSLFFELAACLGYAAMVRWFPRRSWPTILAVSALALLVLIVGKGGLGGVGQVGWVTFFAGFVRVGFPFLLGAAIYRYGWYKRFTGIPAWAGVLLLVVTLFQPIGRVWQYQVLAIFLLLPGVLMISALAPVRRPEIWDWLGRLSYPLYIMHFPVLWLVAWGLSDRLPAPLVIVIGLTVSIAVSTAALLVYDEPLRRWLARRRQAVVVAVPVRG